MDTRLCAFGCCLQASRRRRRKVYYHAMDDIDSVNLNLTSREVCFVCLFTCEAEMTPKKEKQKKGSDSRARIEG